MILAAIALAQAAAGSTVSAETGTAIDAYTDCIADRARAYARTSEPAEAAARASVAACDHLFDAVHRATMADFRRQQIDQATAEELWRTTLAPHLRQRSEGAALALVFDARSKPPNPPRPRQKK